jgi:hypothetical protein
MMNLDSLNWQGHSTPSCVRCLLASVRAEHPAKVRGVIADRAMTIDGAVGPAVRAPRGRAENGLIL